MAGRTKWMWLAAGAAMVGAAAFAAQGGFGGGDGGEARPMVQLPPAAPVANVSTSVASAAAAASLSATVGGYNYEDRKTAVQGKSVALLVDIGGRRIIKKKKTQRK